MSKLVAGQGEQVSELFKEDVFVCKDNHPAQGYDMKRLIMCGCFIGTRYYSFGWKCIKAEVDMDICSVKPNTCYYATRRIIL